MQRIAYAGLNEARVSFADFFRLHTTSRPVTIEVRIPADQVGFIIGRGGETIREIQKKTQTRIEFKDDTMG